MPILPVSVRNASEWLEGTWRDRPPLALPGAGAVTLMLGTSRCMASIPRGHMFVCCSSFPARRLTHNRGEEVLRGSQLSQSRNRGSLQKPHPFSFLTLGGSRCGQPCPTWAPPLLSVMSPERQLGGSNQLLSRPWRTPHPPPPALQPCTSVGRELRVRHIVRPDVDLGSNSLLFFPLEV